MVAPLRRFFSDPGCVPRVEPGECPDDYNIIQGCEQDVYILVMGGVKRPIILKSS
jgi:hypothetical protein